jgi:hypothetical protein
MKVALVVAGILLLLCVSREGFSQWKKEPEIDYPGNDIYGSRGSGHGTLEEARERCESNSACLGFNHENKPVGNFWLKHTLANRGPLPGYSFYSKMRSFLGFKNSFAGPNLCLDIINDGANNKPLMAPCGNYSGQQWSMNPTRLGNVTFSNQFAGANKCLDVVGRNLFMTNCDENSMRQSWKVTTDPFNKSFSSVRNVELQMCVDILNDGNNNKPRMSDCGNFSGQKWSTIQT